MKKPTEIEVSPLFYKILNDVSLEDKMYVENALYKANQSFIINTKKIEIMSTKKSPNTTYSKAELKATDKLKNEFINKLKQLNELGNAIGNNRILVEKGISVTCKMDTKPVVIRNISTIKVDFRISATMPQI